MRAIPSPTTQPATPGRAHRRNDYGFTVGGPVWIPKVYNGRDKTFFFFNWEQFRETTVESTTSFRPSPRRLIGQGDFTTAVTSPSHRERIRSGGRCSKA